MDASRMAGAGMRRAIFRPVRGVTSVGGEIRSGGEVVANVTISQGRASNGSIDVSPRCTTELQRCRR
ncbi:hypothetical protein CHELA41_20386 [Hyphomicrobiales bacterium]|nr:hypothetical protein CHELA41_20386 [Hyphomicrobiales bacterium]